MKELNGLELAGFVKERQAQQVRSLKQEYGLKPKLLILRDSDNPVIKVYVTKKCEHGADIGVEVEDKLVTTEDLLVEVERANKDKDIFGMIVQLPVLKPEMTDEITNGIIPEKDVDGLSKDHKYDGATAMAVNWLLAGYGVELRGKKIALIGYGKLVGRPLMEMWTNSGLDVAVFRSKDEERLEAELSGYDVIVTATGKAGLVKSEMIKEGAVIVDAGTASERGVIMGDVADEVRNRRDVLVTPKIGGVGPLTIVALFDNVIRAAFARVEVSKD